jgi:hypothetical protein
MKMRRAIEAFSVLTFRLILFFPVSCTVPLVWIKAASSADLQQDLRGSILQISLFALEEKDNRTTPILNR